MPLQPRFFPGSSKAALHAGRSQAAAAAALASILAAALGLSGCSDADDPGPQQTQERTQLEYASMKDIRDINPHLYMGELAAQAMVFEPLVKNMPDGSIAPWLARSWKISEDGKTYTFHLREDVRYTDGTPFDAQSVKMNIEAVLENRVRHAWLDLVNEIESVSAVDAHTVELRLRNPYFPTLVELGTSRPFRFISPACMREGSTMRGVSCLAGTGPWKLSEHKRSQYALFVTNEDYWGEKPRMKSLRWNVMPDAQTMLMALQKGEIDLIFGADGDQITTDALSRLIKDQVLAVHLSAPIASRAILLNTARPVTGEASVREAFSRAVNRPAIVSGVLNGLEAEAQTLFSRSTPYCDVELAVRGFDPAQAEHLLDEAGWTRGADGVRVKNGRRLEVSFYYNSQNAQEKAIAETVQADLARIGAKVLVLGEEKQRFLDRQRSGEFDLQYALSWGAPYDPQSYFSSWRFPAHGDYQAQRGLKNKAELDQRILEFLRAPDKERRQALAADILQTVHAAAVYIPISYSRTKVVSTPRLQGVEFAASQYEIPFEKMYFAPAPSADRGR